ncbi:hypothetical protein [Exiguobacterium sp. s193]|uniref:hypothetical protein n=1 Tax=Exiguobacterium sp. s193 TaxID=2751207 RepID=UPI001BE66106|nr:hypothetical protein [Exiguobacterium sp. s193]
MKFTRTPRMFELKWIPESDWSEVCQRQQVTIQNHPLETLVGLAYNNQNQIVQVTRNVHMSHFIYYVTLLETHDARQSLLSTRSHMTIQYMATQLHGSIEVAAFSLVDIHVRTEGLGERGLLLEAFINDIQQVHPYYRVSGDVETITHQGQVSQACFTTYGFQLHQRALVLQNFNDPHLVHPKTVTETV